MKSLSATILLSLVLSFSAQAANESRTKYGSVIGVAGQKILIDMDKVGLVTPDHVALGMKPSDVRELQRGTRVKITQENDGTGWRTVGVVKITGEEAQIKILNRSDCLQHYGTDGATECFKKFPQ